MVKTSDKRLIKYKQQGNLAFQFFIQTQCLGEKENMKLLMSFPLTPVPLSIGTSDGMLLKKNKAKGMPYLSYSSVFKELHKHRFLKNELIQQILYGAHYS